MLDLQKASMLKRISAFILDVILLAVAITGFAFFLSAVTGFDSYNERLNEIEASYASEYGFEFFRRLRRSLRLSRPKSKNDISLRQTRTQMTPRQTAPTE